jgi:hypothetical protein
MVRPLLESVNRRRTDNTMAKRKRTKGQPTIYKTLHEKLFFYVETYIVSIFVCFCYSIGKV